MFLLRVVIVMVMIMIFSLTGVFLIEMNFF